MYSSEHYKLLEFKAGYDLLFSQNKLLQQEINQLKHENALLKDKLNINSTNSSLPPSSDLKRPKKEYVPTGRKRGGQPGHKGTNRKLVDVNLVNKVESVLPQSKCDCGGEVVVDYSNPWRHQKFELPKIMPEITEYQMYFGKCKCCGATYRASGDGRPIFMETPNLL